ncbi:hypothetical protein [Streptomyces sp. NPDC017202]|uniref:hypothetical protein n=1 Tax=Streptomyces sp. NPDC017202 TaxID=3364981 RepID=UPI0037B9351D
MRIRSALAAVVLGVALSAAGAATATAGEGKHVEGGDDHAVCSPYFGGIVTETSKLFWGGAQCSEYAVGHDNSVGRDDD